MPKIIDEEDLERWFTYRAPNAEQIRLMNDVRYQALLMAKVIFASTTPGPDQTLAFRRLRETVMTANLSIMFPED